MTNHYPLLVETAEANLSTGMQLLNGRYSQAFNAQWILPGARGPYYVPFATEDDSRHLAETVGDAFLPKGQKLLTQGRSPILISASPSSPCVPRPESAPARRGEFGRDR